MGNPKIIAVTEKIKGTSGAMVWWSLHGVINLPKLSDALQSVELNLRDDLRSPPKLPEPETCLKRAVKAQTIGSRVLVRPLKGKKGWVVVYETAGEEKNDYNNGLTVKLNKVGHIVFGGKRDIEWETRIQKQYEIELQELHDISSWLVKQLDKLEALCVRDVGGVYFVPAHSVGYWETLVNVITDISECKLYQIDAMHTEHAVQAVCDSLIQEAEKEINKISNDIEKDLGEVALKNRIEKCSKFYQKIEKYEQLLGTKLNTITSHIQELQSELSAALFMAESSDDE